MRIARLELKEIGPFEDAVLEIPPPAEGQRGELVIFEGPNGCGKTTIAQAIACAAGVPAGSWGLAGDDPASGDAPIREVVERIRSATGLAVITVGRGVEVCATRIRRARVDALEPGGLGRAGSQVPELVMGLARASGRANSLAWIPLEWAAFAYRGHQATPVIATRGPTQIDDPPLVGALSFGAVEPASGHFGQLIVNLDQELAKAFTAAHRAGVSVDQKQEFELFTASRQKMLDDIARALSEVLGRKVAFEIPVGQHSPTILLDGENIPLALLGEGMRSTLAWLSDLLVRLYRIRWDSPDRSPLEQDFWLILDEIDESLHPTMQMRILPALRRLFPNARIYITTHSPFVVASAAEGYVFPIRPDARHRVTGAIEPRKLEPGQSLEWVVEEIFGAETGFIDPWTRDALRAHRADITRLRRKDAFGDEDWRAFLARRAKLMSLNEQVQTVVAMQEVPVARAIEARLGEAAE